MSTVEYTLQEMFSRRPSIGLLIICLRRWRLQLRQLAPRSQRVNQQPSQLPLQEELHLTPISGMKKQTLWRDKPTLSSQPQKALLACTRTIAGLQTQRNKPQTQIQ
jgi:hypothetical protein